MLPTGGWRNKAGRSGNCRGRKELFSSRSYFWPFSYDLDFKWPREATQPHNHTRRLTSWSDHMGMNDDDDRHGPALLAAARPPSSFARRPHDVMIITWMNDDDGGDCVYSAAGPTIDGSSDFIIFWVSSRKAWMGLERCDGSHWTMMMGGYGRAKEMVEGIG